MNKLKALKIAVYTALIGFASFVTIVYAAKPTVITMDKTNTISLLGEINATSVSKVMLQIITNSNPELFLFIRSPGGSVFDGQELVNFISHSDKNITCIVSYAASMAFAITQACPTRYILESGVLMQHMASYGLEPMPAPNAKSFTSFVEEMIKTVTKIQADRLGMSVDAFYAKTRDDWWMLGKQAVEQHAADKVVFAQCTSDLTSSEYIDLLTSPFGSIALKWSGCPLIGVPKNIMFPTGMSSQQQLEFVKSMNYRLKSVKQ